MAPPGAQTQLNILHPPLRTLAKYMARRHRLVIDCGGEGQCGPNTLAYLLGLSNLPGLQQADGPAVRQIAVAFASVEANLGRVTNCMNSVGEHYTLGELILECIGSWPEAVRGRLAPTVQTWCSLVARPATWTDLAFLHVLADACKAAIDVTVVNDLSKVWHLGLIEPCNGEPYEVTLEVGMWWNRHLVAIALDANEDAQATGGAAQMHVDQGDGPPPHPGEPEHTDQHTDPVLRGPLDGAAAPSPSPQPRASRATRAIAPHGTASSPRLCAPLRALALSIQPAQVVVDCGGGGDCGNNSLAYLLNLVGAHRGGGNALRKAVVAHAKRLTQRDAPTSSGLNARAFLLASLRTWPRFANDTEATHHDWLRLMGAPRCYVDEGFLAMAADLFTASISYTTVDRRGRQVGQGTFHPFGRPGTVSVALAHLLDEHYVAILDVDGPAATPTVVDSTAAMPTVGATATRHPTLTPTESQTSLLFNLAAAIEASAAEYDSTTAREASAAEHDDDALRLGLAASEAEAVRNQQHNDLEEAALRHALAASLEQLDPTAEAIARLGLNEDLILTDSDFDDDASDEDLILTDWEDEATCKGAGQSRKDDSEDDGGGELGSKDAHATGSSPEQPRTGEGSAGVTSNAAGDGAGDVANDPVSKRRGPSLPLPLDEVTALLQSRASPTVIVACEFSGALSMALERIGHVVLSVDVRPCEIGGLHYQGDVRDVLHLRHWARAYFFPPCFQQLRADADCLELKIADGRAFWGCAFVIWCICCPNADMVIVEQSDTIVHDFLTTDSIEGASVFEFRSSGYGDARDKFIRLTLRNASMPTPPYPQVKRPREPNAHLRFRNPEARDRARSTWTTMPNTAIAVATATAHSHTMHPLDFGLVMTRFARAWHDAGHPVPSGYANPSAQPASAQARAYQSVRGPGSRRRLTSVVPTGCQPHTEPPPTACATLLAHDSPARAALDSPPPPTPVGMKRPTHPPSTAGTEAEAEEEAVEMQLQPKPDQLIDLREASSTAALLVFITVLGQPLVLAHVDGFTTAGLVLPIATRRAAAMLEIQKLCGALVTSASYIAFMIGEYSNGTRVFTAPIDYCPPESASCRSPDQRRRLLTRGAAFVWCTLAALQGTPLADPAARAILGCQMFVKPLSSLPDDPNLSSGQHVEFNFGVERARSIVSRPVLDHERSPPAWRALAHMGKFDAALALGLGAAVAAGDALLDGWMERITPMPIGEIPSHLLDNLPDFGDSKLDSALLSAQQHPLSTPWLPLPPQQPAAPAEAPECPASAADMLTGEGRRRLEAWMEATRQDLVTVRDGLEQGLKPDEIERRRPKAVAIGQSELVPWARGRVWDCRKEVSDCCIVADFRAPILENLARGELRRRLSHYPDQTLVANLLEGARLDADVELQLVLVPHLLSLAKGYASVAKELKRLEGEGWYRSYIDIPFMPMYFNGQGAAARKLEDRWRRCVEGGGPRQVTYDAEGVRAISLNDAAHIRFMPGHFKSDQRPEFRQWLSKRGLPPPEEETPEEGGVMKASKWPKERKPHLTAVMRDMAVFGRAAHRLATAVYSAGDDAKDYFNNIPMAASELHKVGVAFLDDSTDEVGRAKLRYVSEKVLGFGTHGASNLAQRLSDAIVVMFYEDMDAMEAEAMGHAASNELAWLEERLALMRRKGEACHDFRRFTQLPAHRLPDIPAPAKVGDIPHGYVCPQLRLYSAYMYTDDNQLLFVGTERTIRGLRAWRLLVTRINLRMAIDEKRSLGTWSKWLGALILAGLGLVVVPKEKILRASQAVTLVLEGGAEFHVYRSLCGLLEHLRAISLRGRNVMHGLYRPHGPDGASREGPNALVKCDELMRKQLERWRRMLTHACGVSVKQALLRDEVEALPTVHFDLTSDACLADVEVAGIGGFAHGLWWYFAVPGADKPLLSIPILEFLGVCFNILTFHPHLARLGAGTRILLRTDALTAARTLPEASMRSRLLVEAYQWLVQRREWLSIAPRAACQHCFGDCNPLSDAISRAKWGVFQRLCEQLGVRPIQVALAEACSELYGHIMRVLRSRPAGARPVLHATAIELGTANNGASARQPFAHDPAEPLRPPSAFEILRAACGKPHGGAPPAATSYNPLARTADSAFTILNRARDAAEAVEARPSTSPSALDSLRMARRQAMGEHHRGEPPSAAPSQGYSAGDALATQRRKRNADDSALARASRQHAKARMLTFTEGGEPGMALRGGLATVMNRGEEVEETVTYGVNANTWDKDCRAWDMWEDVCSEQGTSPLRTAAEARDFPERNAHLLAVLMLRAKAVCKPRRASQSSIKPRSALAYPLAIIRVFARWAVPMPSYKALKASLSGLARMYIAHHGPYSLAPQRAEPMKFSMVRTLDAIPDGAPVGRIRWDYEDHDVFMFRRLNRVMIVTAFRLGEVVRHTSGEIMFLTFESLVWSIGGVLVANPSAAQLQALRSGIDGARLAPPRSKPDQWGEIHCPFAAVLTYQADDPTNAAAALRDVELRQKVKPSARATTPLFADASGEAYTHHHLHLLLKAALTYCYGKAVAELYSWHSYRSGLATALHAAGVEDSMIQLICRWMCPESLHVYRRMGVQEHERLIKKASLCNVDLLQSNNAPKVFADQGFAQLVDEISGPRSDASQRAYEDALKAALDPYSREESPAKQGQARTPPRGSRTHQQHRRPAQAAGPSAQPQGDLARPGRPVTERPPPGTRVAVPRDLWPSYDCQEMGGTAWHAVVKASSSLTALVEFTHHTAALGRPYRDERLPLSAIRHLAN